MKTPNGEPRVCKNGHQYFKSSDCPTCPICEDAKKPHDGLLSKLPAPARRALQSIGVDSVTQLARFSEAEILKLHGMGPASIPKLKQHLNAKGLSFKTSK